MQMAYFQDFFRRQQEMGGLRLEKTDSLFATNFLRMVADFEEEEASAPKLHIPGGGVSTTASFISFIKEARKKKRHFWLSFRRPWRRSYKISLSTEHQFPPMGSLCDSVAVSFPSPHRQTPAVASRGDRESYARSKYAKSSNLHVEADLQDLVEYVRNEVVRGDQGGGGQPTLTAFKIADQGAAVEANTVNLRQTDRRRLENKGSTDPKKTLARVVADSVLQRELEATAAAETEQAFVSLLHEYPIRTPREDLIIPAGVKFHTAAFISLLSGVRGRRRDFFNFVSKIELRKKFTADTAHQIFSWDSRWHCEATADYGDCIHQGIRSFTSRGGGATR
ncbi:hypothetical protein Esti_005568 [Eimeria stiedai]